MGVRQKKLVESVAAVPKEQEPVATAPSVSIVIGATAGIAAAWFAAGDIGMVAHPLRHALTWAALLVAVVTVWLPRRRTGRQWLILMGGVVAGAVLTMSPLAVYNIFAVVVVLALLAWDRSGLSQRVLLITALATSVLGIYRITLISIPTVWTLADGLGTGLGNLAGAFIRRPLWIGATFGGVDLLVLMVALYVGWLVATPGPRWIRGLSAGWAILVGHLAYLMLLGIAPELRAWLPVVPPPPEVDQYVPPAWHWSTAVSGLIPWGLPLVGVVVQLSIAAMMFRWATWSVVGEAPEKPANSAIAAPRERLLLQWAPWLLAVLVPLVASLSLGQSELTGKKIVAYNEGYLNWNKPEFDRYGRGSAGAYGMLPTLIESLGGQLVRSDKLSEADLSQADVLLLIHPMQPWPKELQDRVWNYVRGGGSLLLVAEPQLLEDGAASVFNEVLKPTSMRVRFDTAIAGAYKWEQLVEALSHPATPGLAGNRNWFGLIRGSSIALSWPARPILIGLWGWSDPGSDASMTEMFRYEAGERLGDLVMAAEQSVGEGRVVVLADPYGLTNEGISEAYPFTGRLFGYLAWRPSNPQNAWRQLLGLAGCVALAILLVWRPAPLRLAAAAVVLTGAMAAATGISGYQSRVLPDGSKGRPFKNVAYIDASHQEAYSNVDWSVDNIMGLRLTLMRSGYLPLLLPEISAEALERAGMLISIAPAKPYSEGEREIIRNYVENGGAFVCTVGAEHAAPVLPLLNDFSFNVPLCPRPVGDESEAKPMGNIRGSYLTGESYRADVRLYAAWPIEYPRQGTDWIVAGREGKPAMAGARVGHGRVVVIGDTEFAFNKNLEYIGGESFDGRYDNAQFWRWLINQVNDLPPWTPPNGFEEDASTEKSDDAKDNAAKAAVQGIDKLEPLKRDLAGPKRSPLAPEAGGKKVEKESSPRRETGGKRGPDQPGPREGRPRVK
jgi:hypothetical protein